jgi:hypothetical protein
VIKYNKLPSEKSTIFWNITPCSPLKLTRRFGVTYRVHIQGRRINQRESRWQFTLVTCSAYFSTLKMEAICSSKASVDTQQTTEDGTLHNHRCEHLKSYTVKLRFCIAIAFTLVDRRESHTVDTETRNTTHSPNSHAPRTASTSRLRHVASPR